MKKGILKVTTAGSYGDQVFDYSIIVDDSTPIKVTYISNFYPDDISVARVYADYDPLDEAYIDDVFNQMGTNSYLWTTPLTTVHSGLDNTYPVGAIFTTVNPNFDPNVELGGTWKKYDESNKIEWLRTA